MMFQLLPKPSLDAFIASCTPLATITHLEEDIQKRVENIAAALLNFDAFGSPVDVLTRFLKADRDFLGVILSLTNLSQERFLRLLSAERFARGDFNPEWGPDQIYRKLHTMNQISLKQ